MGSEIYVQIFLAELDAEGLCLVVGIAADDDALAIGTLKDNGLETVFYRIEGDEGAARLYEVREVLVGVIFGRVPPCGSPRSLLDSATAPVDSSVTSAGTVTEIML